MQRIGTRATDDLKIGAEYNIKVWAKGITLKSSHTLLVKATGIHNKEVSQNNNDLKTKPLRVRQKNRLQQRLRLKNQQGTKRI